MHIKPKQKHEISSQVSKKRRNLKNISLHTLTISIEKYDVNIVGLGETLVTR